MWNWLIRLLEPSIKLAAKNAAADHYGTRLGSVVSDAEAALYFETSPDDIDTRSAIITNTLRERVNQHLEFALPALTERFVEEFLEGRPVEVLFKDGGLRLDLSARERRQPQDWWSEEQIAELNTRCHAVLRANHHEWLAMVQDYVRARVTSVTPFDFGWTGWKVSKSRDSVGSQFLVCAAPYGDGERFPGGRVYVDKLGGQHFPEFFGVSIAPMNETPHPTAYDMGDNIGTAVVPAKDLKELLMSSDAALAEWMYVSFAALRELVTERVDAAQKELV